MDAMAAFLVALGSSLIPDPTPPSSAAAFAWQRTTDIVHVFAVRSRSGPSGVDPTATAPRIVTGGDSLKLPREVLALRRAAQALGYDLPDPDAQAAPASAAALADPLAAEFRAGLRVCVRYVTRF